MGKGHHIQAAILALGTALAGSAGAADELWQRKTLADYDGSPKRELAARGVDLSVDVTNFLQALQNSEGSGWTNGGKADSLNVALDAARFPYVLACDADTLIERRRRMAEDKIEAAERQAVAGVRQAAADAAAKTARAVIAGQLSAAQGKQLVNDAIDTLRVN